MQDGTTPAAAAAAAATSDRDPAPANLSGTTNNNCTLGEAILAANTGLAVDGCALSGSDAPFTIQLQAGQTYTLASVHNYWYGPKAVPQIATTVINADRRAAERRPRRGQAAGSQAQRHGPGRNGGTSP
jgi:hypothetical protein